MEASKYETHFSLKMTYSPDMARLLGSVKEAIFLGQLWYHVRTFEDKYHKKVDWFFRTTAEMEKSTALTRWEQELARKHLGEKGILQEKKGQGYKIYYKINTEKYDLLVDTYIDEQEEKLSACSKPSSQLVVNPQAGSRETLKPIYKKKKRKREEEATPRKEPAASSPFSKFSEIRKERYAGLSDLADTLKKNAATIDAVGAERVTEGYRRFMASDDNWQVEHEHPIGSFIKNLDKWLPPVKVAVAPKMTCPACGVEEQGGMCQKCGTDVSDFGDPEKLLHARVEIQTAKPPGMPSFKLMLEKPGEYALQKAAWGKEYEENSRPVREKCKAEKWYIEMLKQEKTG